MLRIPNPPGRALAGFGLVELMVGIVIALFTILIMLKQLSFFEGDKRTTTGGADAQNTGAVALYAIQRDIRQAGYGVAWQDLFTCTMSLASGGTVPVAPVVINPATTIVPAGDSNTDTLLVLFGNNDNLPHGNVIPGDPPPPGPPYKVQSPDSFRVGDIVMAAPVTCGAALLPRVVTAVGADTITAASGSDATRVYNLGSTPTMAAYAIRDGNLTMCNYMVNNCGAAKASMTASAWAAQWPVVANNVISMRAQYGVDTSDPMDRIVDTYNQTTPNTLCGWSKVSAVRLAIVARSTQYNKEDVTTTAPLWTGSGAAPIDLTADAGVCVPGATVGTCWRHYRYRTFETTVPIRNFAWLVVDSYPIHAC